MRVLAEEEVRGEVHIKGAHLHGATHFAAKLATGFYANAAKGLPVSSGLSVIADAETGFPEVIALDNGYLTELRTGAAGAAATEALSRPDAAVVALGDVIAGRAPGRTSPAQITVADLTGLGAEDAAIGTALARAL